LDIISGLVTITSTFFLGAAVSAVLATRPGADAGGNAAKGLARSVLGTLVVVYFSASTVLLVIAQQYGLAGGNAVIGLLLVFVQFAESSLRPAPRPAEATAEASDDGEAWRR
jgi:hypothetical protein